MPDGQIAHAFLCIVASCGREERFTFKICSDGDGRRLIAWTPGALVPMVVHDGDHPCLLDPLVRHTERYGMPVQVEVRSARD